MRTLVHWQIVGFHDRSRLSIQLLVHPNFPSTSSDAYLHDMSAAYSPL